MISEPCDNSCEMKMTARTLIRECDRDVNDMIKKCVYSSSTILEMHIFKLFTITSRRFGRFERFERIFERILNSPTNTNDADLYVKSSLKGLR